jgi:tRNA(Arg) A34 adenosine deaminase TadA
MSEHDEYIRQAIALASQARAHGNHPFGALLVHNNRVVLTAENTVSSENNPTHHAETNLVNKACQELDKNIMQQSTLYTSCEPCPMCTGAIFWCGIRRVVFSVQATTLGSLANDSFCGPCSAIFDRAGTGQRTEVIGPILEEEGVLDHTDFWKSLGGASEEN